MPSSPSLFDSPYWTEADARLVLEALARSGQSVRAFAAAHGVTPQRFYARRRRVAVGDRTTFEEVLVRPSPVPRLTDGAPFEVVLGSGIVVRVPPSFEGASFACLLEILGRARAEPAA